MRNAETAPVADRSQEHKTKRKRFGMLVLSIVSMLSLLTAITYSWFINSEVDVDTPVDVGVANAPIMYVGSIHDGQVSWGSDLNLATISPIAPLCGNGVDFFTPVTMTYREYRNYVEENDIDLDVDEIFEKYKVYSDVNGDYRITDRAVVGYLPAEEKTVSESVYTVDIAVRSGLSGKMYLDAGSRLSPAESSRPSPYLPDVSTGNIAGAMRVAILQHVGEDYVLRCVWIPNAQFQFDKKSETFTDSGVLESRYLFVDNTDAEPFGTEIFTAEHPDGYAEIDGVLYVWDLDKCNLPFSEYSSGVDEYRIVVWLDGGDRECVDALSGGKVDLRLGIRIEGQ